MRVVLSFVAAAVMCCSATLFAQDVNPQEKIRSFEEYAPWLDPSLELRDYHIHLRGGMTPERAVEREKDRREKGRLRKYRQRMAFQPTRFSTNSSPISKA